MLKRGDMVRVASSHPTFPGEVGIVEVTIGAGSDTLSSLNSRVRLAFVKGGKPRFLPAWDVYGIGPDDLTDEECAQVMKWKLRHEGR